jgi:hypothetical protein
MLMWLWRLLITGTPGPSRTDVLLQTLIEQQSKTNDALFNAVAQIGEASQRQAEVLNSYLKLFQGPGEPQRWVDEPEEHNAADLIKQGYPKDGSEAEQAEWVLKHLDIM